jgi:chemotaxis protein MotB
MARHKKPHLHNHERWLVSYADLLTLLFAFFVVMFASTQSDHVKAKKISEAVEKALRGGSLSPGLASMLKGPRDENSKTPVPPPHVDLSAAYQALHTKLNNEIDREAVRLHMEPRGIVISLSAQVVFPSGGDSIDERVYPIIGKVADVLRTMPNALRLEGHTDSIPISTARFRSNWELSAARSIAMMRLLRERFGIDHNRMAIVGYADTNAIGDNETEEGRMRNRRVDIVIVSDFGMNSEPGKGANQ